MIKLYLCFSVNENSEESKVYESKVYESLLTKRYVTLGTNQQQSTVNLLPKPRKQSKSKGKQTFFDALDEIKISFSLISNPIKTNRKDSFLEE